jgi:hypothetical protein
MAQPPALVESPCANCGSAGSGRFCGECGQRRDVHLHSVGHFVGEAAEVLTHADSSVWRTFVPLLTKPGFLTREFLAGRRARYLQPFRLYLIASVLFFLVNGWNHKGTALFTDAPAKPAAAAAAAGTAAPRPGVETYTGETSCEKNGLQGTSLAWLAPRVESTCRSINADNGREFGRAVYHNLGRAMFLFVPLLAAFMKLLYWRPKRWYLEHLLLLLHNHAAAFVALSLLGLVEFLVTGPGLQALLGFAMALYLAWYVYRSMRNTYGQGRLMTSCKFLLVGIAYIVSAALMFVLTAAYSALTL